VKRTVCCIELNLPCIGNIKSCLAWRAKFLKDLLGLDPAEDSKKEDPDGEDESYNEDKEEQVENFIRCREEKEI
jgi:hypothetical protein